MGAGTARRWKGAGGAWGHEAKQVNGVANRGQHRARCSVSLLPALARGGVVCTCACAGRPASPHLRLFLASAYSFRRRDANGKRGTKEPVCRPRADERAENAARRVPVLIEMSFSLLVDASPRRVHFRPRRTKIHVVDLSPRYHTSSFKKIKHQLSLRVIPV